MYPPRTCQRLAICRKEPPTIKQAKRKIFCVRHVDDKLIARVPSADPSPIDIDYTPRSPCYRAARSIESPWYRNTFQMETVSSLLRQKPKIIQSSGRPRGETNCGWYTYDQHQTSPHAAESLQAHQQTHLKNRESLDSQYAYQQDDNDKYSLEKREVDTHWIGHNSELCTLCQLYYDYFGICYPMHN